MIVRENTTIAVDEKPNSTEIKLMYPLIKELAIYWSATKRKWFVSCRCSEREAGEIKEMYSHKSPEIPYHRYPNNNPVKGMRWSTRTPKKEEK